MEFIGDLERSFAAVIYPNRFLVAIVGALAIFAVAVVARRRGWTSAARHHPRLTAAVLVPALAIALPLGWYLGSPVFLSTTVDEPAPLIATAASPTAAISTATSSPAPSAASAPPTIAPTPSPQPLIARSGAFHGMDEFHFGRGTARLIETAPGLFVVRLEKFEVRNGPDLFVYLSPDGDGYAKGAVEVGRLKANKGNQNYELPAGTDVSSAASVIIWCKQFSVLFATAPLSAS
jgi:electron transfer DM13